VNEGKPVLRDHVAVEKLRMEVDISERPAKIIKRTYKGHFSVVASAFQAAPKRTETSFDTPGSCMVTPYSTGAMLIVFLL
jgi:hypothetical protein